jgi:hypothetical protein
MLDAEGPAVVVQSGKFVGLVGRDYSKLIVRSAIAG